MLQSARQASAPRVRHGGLALVTVMVLLAAAVASWLNLDTSGAQPRMLHGTAAPPPGVGEQATRLATPASAASGRGGYAFEHTRSDGTPVTWDPCRAIHYVTSGAAPAGAQSLVASALIELTRLTGFAFVDDGTTSEAPANPRTPYQPERYGRRWAPVLIAWTDPAAVPALDGETIGLGGATPDGTVAYVSGLVYLDAPQFARTLTAASDVQNALRGAVLHELGHLLGLDHVTNPSSLMYPDIRRSVTDYSAADRRGLYVLSTGRCAPTV